ncbi:hypothetical protein FACS1894168_1930 [Deltaproteobacteria bacterium]|nr:hypothetical protein FACS1894168_1930 [Deltaproteobacteria bacterium]GHV53123.1 hypothetical protein FACS1894206_03200 [Deltaproteobacteria bacterium]
MKKVLFWLGKLENFILIATFSIMLLASFAQVVNRNLIQASIGWFEELARYCMIYMALLATELGLRDSTQMSITAFVDRLSPWGRKGALLFTKAILVAFSGVLFLTSFDFLQAQFSFGQTSPGLGIPMYLPYFALPLSFGIITLVQVALLVRIFLLPTSAPEFGKGKTA